VRRIWEGNIPLAFPLLKRTGTRITGVIAESNSTARNDHEAPKIEMALAGGYGDHLRRLVRYSSVSRRSGLAKLARAAAERHVNGKGSAGEA
jgi:hypothetical protein